MLYLWKRQIGTKWFLEPYEEGAGEIKIQSTSPRRRRGKSLVEPFSFGILAVDFALVNESPAG